MGLFVLIVLLRLAGWVVLGVILGLFAYVDFAVYWKVGLTYWLLVVFSLFLCLDVVLFCIVF